LKNGKATFYVKAIAPKDGLILLVSSADETKQAIWENISFQEPPVPQITFACIFDRNGDGTMEHSALYVGNDTYVHAKGKAYGVVADKFSSAKNIAHIRRVR
jgi:cell wall-associated NlpC family hydrolase